MIKVNDIVELKDGRKGKVVGQLDNGEYVLSCSQNGSVTYFNADDIKD